MLNTSDYQNIVDRVIGILGKNINIMNTSGIIVASGDEARIGSFHEIAAIAAAENREIIVGNFQAPEFQGVRAGVNLPITFNGAVVGVVGITGAPDEVDGYGKIIKELVELMVHEKHQKKLDLFQYRAARDLVKEFIKPTELLPDEILNLTNRAALVGFDIYTKRVLILVGIAGFNEYITSSSLTEVEIQELKQSIIDLIVSTNTANDLAFNLNNDRFIILKSDIHDVFSYCENKQMRIFKRLGVRTIFSIGNECNCIEDYRRSYESAENLIDIASRLNSVNVISKENYILQLLLNSVPNSVKQDYLIHFADAFENDKNNILNTIKTFFECGMDFKSTANALFVHKNTLIYRLNRFKEITQIDPFNPYQCMKIYLAIILKEL